MTNLPKAQPPPKREAPDPAPHHQIWLKPEERRNAKDGPVVVSLNTWGGDQNISFRQTWNPEEDGQYKFTKSGFNIPEELLPDVVNALLSVYNHMCNTNLQVVDMGDPE